MPKKETAPGVTPATPAQVMYIGPSLLRPVFLQHKSVYADGVPLAAKQLAEKDADLAGCFAPLSEAGKALRELEGYPGTVAGEHTRRFLAVRKRYLEEAKK
ncbi:MAG: hypothetical protein LBC94_02790 [Desulfovibrio sp.]|jgi:hypothetical protein|nr:hypothetical protein [Desulfovibrio sp.]